MPIQPFFRYLYRGSEWEWLRERALKRANYRCEDCGTGGLLVKLHVSHDNHDPRDRRWKNLVVRCTACHNTHDGAMKAMTARRTWAASAGQVWIAQLEFAHLPRWAELMLRRRRRDADRAARAARRADAEAGGVRGKTANRAGDQAAGAAGGAHSAQ